MLCVGGRLHKSCFNDSCKHPVLLPKEERVSLLLMQWCHGRLPGRLVEQKEIELFALCLLLVSFCLFLITFCLLLVTFLTIILKYNIN